MANWTHPETDNPHLRGVLGSYKYRRGKSQVVILCDLLSNLGVTTNAIERPNEQFRRRIKTQTVLPCAETVPMLLWALMTSGQTPKRKVDGWQTLDKPIDPMPLDLAA